MTDRQASANKVDASFKSLMFPYITDLEINSWFTERFHAPLDTQFLGNDDSSAEGIRQKRKQLKSVETYILNLRKNSS